MRRSARLSICSANSPVADSAVTQRPSVRVMPVRRSPYLVHYIRPCRRLLILHIRHGARAPVKPEEL